MSKLESELKAVRDRALALSAGASATTQNAAREFWSGAKKLTAPASDVFPVHITNPTVVSGLERAGLADALPEQLATTRPASRRRLKIAVISVAVLAAGAAAFSITRRTRPQPPSVAAAPPRLADVPVADEEPLPTAGTV
jgi:Cell wall synthesis protein CwsA